MQQYFSSSCNILDVACVLLRLVTKTLEIIIRSKAMVKFWVTLTSGWNRFGMWYITFSLLKILLSISNLYVLYCLLVICGNILTSYYPSWTHVGHVSCSSKGIADSEALFSDKSSSETYNQLPHLRFLSLTEPPFVQHSNNNVITYVGTFVT